MSNEKKIFELLLKYYPYSNPVENSPIKQALSEMAAWKQEQMIEKACELYRKEFVSLNNLLVAYDKEAFTNWMMIDDSVSAFKKAMKGE